MPRPPSTTLDSVEKIAALKELLACNPNTGDLWWIKEGGRRTVGKLICPHPISKGYRIFHCRSVTYGAHRVVWAFVNGPIPDGLQIDHINGVRHDNRIENLRLVNTKTNCENKHEALPNNRSGYLGVSYHKTKKRYCASIRISGKLVHLGYYPTPEAAHQAYLEAKRRLHAGCTI